MFRSAKINAAPFIGSMGCGLLKAAERATGSLALMSRAGKSGTMALSSGV